MVWLLYVQDKLGNAPWMPSCEMDVTLFFPCSTHMRLLAWLASSLDPFTPHFSLLATQSSLLKPSLLTHSAILAPSLLTQSCIPCPRSLNLPPPSLPPSPPCRKEGLPCTCCIDDRSLHRRAAHGVPMTQGFAPCRPAVPFFPCSTKHLSSPIRPVALATAFQARKGLCSVAEKASSLHASRRPGNQPRRRQHPSVAGLATGC